MSWFWLIERKLVEALLSSPLFHRGVQQVHKRVHQLQHGKPPEFYGGTNLEQPSKEGGLKTLAKLFMEELRSGHKPPSPPKK